MKRPLIVVFTATLTLLSAVASTSRITFEKPAQRWLWGGFGFHNSEATMAQMMTDEFRDQRVLKTFREISPTYARVFAGFANWTKEAMDAFADYYDATFRKAGTTLYVVPGRMPVVTDGFDVEEYCEAVATRLEYLVRKRNLAKLRYYCIANEMSVGSTYAWFAKHHDLYAELNRGMQRAFGAHGLDIGLQTPDSSGFNTVAEIDWAISEINEQTDTYCWHYYDRKHQPGDPSLYEDLSVTLTNLVAKCMKKEKRLSLGEFGFTGRTTPLGKGRMRDDAHAGFRDPNGVFAREAAISRAEMGLAALNAGCVSAVSWTMVDYPDPFLREDGDTPEEKRRYDVARFSGFGLDVRYNKNGLFRWCDDERDYSSYPDLYTMGYLVRLFRKGARVLPGASDDPTLRFGGVTNPNGSASFAVVNWGAAKTVELVVAHPLAKPLRVYEYDSAKPPYSAFNDLQPAKGTAAEKDGVVTVDVPARSLTFLTTDYVDRVPTPVSGISAADGIVRWKASADPEHVYYRVYCDEKQVASTVATSAKLEKAGKCMVTSVDRWGNEGAR